MREEHWVDADLIGKGKHIRTVPVPVWAKRAVDEWVNATDISDGPISHRRRSGISLRRRPPGLKSRIWLRVIFDACAPAYAISRAANWSRSSSSSAAHRSKQRSAISGASRSFGRRLTMPLGWRTPDRRPPSGLPARNTAGSPNRRPGRLRSTGARPLQSSFLRSAALENLQINQLQILKISNLKFDPAIMSGA